MSVVCGPIILPPLTPEQRNDRERRIESIVADAEAASTPKAIILAAMDLCDDAEQFIEDGEKELAQDCVRNAYAILDGLRFQQGIV